MKVSGLVFSAACLTTAAHAIPTASPDASAHGKTGFSIAQNARTRVGGKNGASAYRRALRRYGASVPADTDTAAELHVSKVATTSHVETSGNATTTPELGETLYLTPVKVGNTVMNLDIDTGSSDLWVFSDLLPAAEQAGHATYQTKAADFTGDLAQGYSWTITYGDNSGAQGAVYTDTVTLANIPAADQAVEAAINVSPGFAADRNTDGIFGFGFSSLNNIKPTPAKTWFDNVRTSLAAPVFAAALKHNAPGVYDFGYLNASRYTGTIAYRPVDTRYGFWEIHGGGYYVGTQKFSQGPGTFDMIADTGTSLILGPDDMVENYYSQVPSARGSALDGGVVFLCSDTLPDFGLVVDSQPRMIPGSLMNYAPAHEEGYCFGGLQASGGLPFAIIGDVFFKGMYVVFDAGQTRLGFAQAA